MLETNKKNMYSKKLHWKMLILGGSVVTRIRLESSLPVDVVHKYDRNDRKNKCNQSRFKCLIVTSVKK